MQKKWTGYLLLVPILILILGTYGYPLVDMARLSLLPTQFGIETSSQDVSLNNYINAIDGYRFPKAFHNTIVWTAVNLMFQLSIPLGLALILNQHFRGNGFARVLMLVPWITPVVVIAILARWILEPNLGIVNTVLLDLHVIAERISFLGSPAWAMPTLIALMTWKFIPFGTLLILSALQNIPTDTFEAARVDGAGAWQLFRKIIFPMLGPMIGFVGFLAFVWNFNSYALIQLTTQGGPLNTTLTLPVLIYRKAFKGAAMGEAAAIATMISLTLILLGILYFKYLWRRPAW